MLTHPNQLFQETIFRPLVALAPKIFTRARHWYWLSMVLRLRQHNIGYTADGFYRSDDPTNSVKALKEGG